MPPSSDNALYDDPALAQFYDTANGWAADFDYCAALARDARSVLDLGCGTGELAAALGEGRSVTGVDPAAAMLDIARARPGGDRVAWVEADARDLRLGQRFDLILLTSHSFQVFLTDDDQHAALATIAAHLAPSGRFIFDTRNPAIGVRESREPTRRTLTHPTLGPIEAWNQSTYDPAMGILSYKNGYRVLSTGKTASAPAHIRYTPREDLAAKITAAGLSVDTWLGDWHGAPFGETSREIIPLGRLR